MNPASMAHNMTILDEGTLYVAKLSSDIPPGEIDGSGKLPAKGSFSGTGTWLPLLRSGPGGQAESLVDGISAQEAAVFTRMAADKAGATKMDRPEDFEANPKTGKVYVALTNNDERGATGRSRPGCGQPAQRQQERPDPRDHRRSRRHRFHLGPPAGLRRPGGGRHLLRGLRQDARSAPSRAPTTWRSTATATCGSRPTATRWTPTTVCSRWHSTARTAARSSSSSPCRWARRPAAPSSPTTW